MAVDHNTLMRVMMRDRAKLFAYIWSIVRDVHLAEDVLQEVSLLALDKSQVIENEQVLPAWLRTTCRFRALRALENKHRLPTPLDDHLLDQLDQQWGKTDGQTPGDLIDALRDCVAKLTPRARKMLRMRYADGMSGSDVADAAGIKADSVYKSLGRIHRTLADCIRGIRGADREVARD
jgi:RNA polymerase sigma-70 factor (ECF subfamily)